MTEETGTIQVRRTKILQQDIHMYTSLSSQDNGRRRKKDAANKSGNPNTQPSFLSGNEKRITILGLVEKRKKKKKKPSHKQFPIQDYVHKKSLKVFH